MTSEGNTPNHRKPYLPVQSRWWWTQDAFFRRYMLREGTSVFVLLFSLELIAGLLCLRQGESAWNNWLEILSWPALVAFNLLALSAVFYHAVTWFKLAPKIMVVRVGNWKLPEQMMITGQWLGMLLFTAVLIGLAVLAGGNYGS